jgi:hypothetical protein
LPDATRGKGTTIVKLKHLIMTAVALATLMYTQTLTQADPLIFVNPPPVFSVGQGETVPYSITITNSGPGTLTVAGLAAGGFFLITNPGVPEPGFAVNISPFHTNFNFSPDPVFSEGESRSALAMIFTVGPNVPFGTYRAPFTIFYFGATGVLLSISQDITVHVIPEPTTMLLFGTGLIAGVAKVGRRRRALLQER